MNIFNGSLFEPTDSGEGDHVATPTECATPTPLDEPKPKVDARVEVGRLFKQLKSGKQDTQQQQQQQQQQQPKPFPATTVTPAAKKADKRAWPKPLYMQLGPWVSETPSEDFLVAMCRDVMTELDVGGKLLKFCCNLPIVTSLVGGAAFASSAEIGGEGAEGGDIGIAPFIKR